MLSAYSKTRTNETKKFGKSWKNKRNTAESSNNLRDPAALHLVREAGLEPARPEWTLEPESSESANSTTRACFVLR